MNDPNTSPIYGVLWFPAEGLLIQHEYLDRVFTAIGKKDDRGSVELPVKGETSDLPLWDTSVATKISSKYLFWEYPSQRRIEHIKRTEFPIPIIGAVALAIDAEWPANEVDRKQIISYQVRFLYPIVSCMEDMDTPLLILCLRHKEQETPTEELLGTLLPSPHFEIAAYHIDELDNLKGRLLEFLEKAEEQAANRRC